MAALRRWVARAIDQLQGRPPQVRRPQRIFFIHIAKTAGTSMRRMLEREFGAQLVYPGSPHLRRIPDACYPHGSAMLARATRRLETLDFVGLTERFGESCALFDARFGTAVSRSVRRDLVHRPEGSELAEFIPRLEPFLEHDRALYERAQAAFVPAG